MKSTFKKLTALMAAMVLCLAMSVSVFALDFEKKDGLTVTTGGIEGIKVTTTTDKDSYKNGDKITYSITVENTSNVDIGNITLSYTIDGGQAELKQKSHKIELIKAGESKTLTVQSTAITVEGSGSELNTGIIIAIIAAVAVIIIVVIVIIIIKKKKGGKKVVASLLVFAMAGSLPAMVNTQTVKADETKPIFNKVSVHDPSIVKDPSTGTYYIFGSHRAWAKSDDLMNWKTFSNNISTDYQNIFSDVWNNYCTTEKNNSVTGNCWAPDVIYNETMGKWCMYMSINGNDWHSAIVLLTADKIEGPYTYVDEVVFSGATGSAQGSTQTMTIKASKNAKAGDTVIEFDARITLSEVSEAVTRYEYSDMKKVLGEDTLPARYTSTDIACVNAIDPAVTYDNEGNLWMTYGSWSAGIYQLKLDKNTGLRDYNEKYETVTNVSDAYLGIKVAGGYYNSGEGPYILKTSDYYYLFISYGNLEASGGYNMRIYRSKSYNGPYEDMSGKSPIFKSWITSVGYNSNSTPNKYNSTYGLKIFGSYDMYGITDIQVAQGHNSAFVDDDGKMYLIYHSRYKNSGEGHSVRVHQLFTNEDGWLVAAPYEYSGETLPQNGYSTDKITGTYEFVIHDPTKVYVANNDAGIMKPVSVTLNANGTISGEKTGSWKVTSGANVTMTIDGVEYKGVFLEQANELSTRDLTMTFTVAGNNVTAWGVKNPANN